jgi:hypothetical protein
VTAGLAANTGHGERVRGFLADSLALWTVDGTVTAGALPVVAVIETRGGTTVCVEYPAGNDDPWRWFVRWRGPGMREERTRPCASLVALLNTLRGVLGVERGSAVRVAAAPVNR